MRVTLCGLTIAFAAAAAPVPAPAPEPEKVAVNLSGAIDGRGLSLATEGGDWSSARFIVSDKDGKGRIAVSVQAPEQRFPPCHPGCFPAGTPTHAPGGARAVERLRVGDLVTTVGPDGTRGQGKVA